MPVIHLLHLSPKFTLHCLLCDNEAELCSWYYAVLSVKGAKETLEEESLLFLAPEYFLYRFLWHT